MPGKSKRPPYFGDFTEEAAEAMAQAVKLIKDRRHPAKLCDMHLLYGLTQVRFSITAMILGVDLADPNLIVERIEDRLGILATEVPGRAIPKNLDKIALGSKLKNAVTLARKMAKQTPGQLIKTEHLLFGLLEKKTSAASQILSELGVNYEVLRQTVDSIIANSLKTKNPP